MSLYYFWLIAGLSMVPVTELRLTIPLFLSCSQPPSWLVEIIPSIVNCPELPTWFVLIAAIIGNTIPNLILLWIFPWVTKWLHNHAAPQINTAVLWLRKQLIENKRLFWLQAFGVLAILIVEIALWHVQIHSIIWHLAVIIVPLLWYWIAYRIARKAYQAAKRESSIIHWFYAKVSQEHSQTFYQWGGVALILIVGIPIPGTGSWTGSLLAFLFNIPYWKAAFYIFLGICLAGLIVTAVSNGIISSFGVL